LPKQLIYDYKKHFEERILSYLSSFGPMSEIELLKRIFDPKDFKWSSKWRRIALFYEVLTELKDKKRIDVVKDKIKLIL
jgi:hypothetical protein